MRKYVEPVAYAALFLPVVGISIGGTALIAGITLGAAVGAVGLAYYFKLLK